MQSILSQSIELNEDFEIIRVFLGLISLLKLSSIPASFYNTLGPYMNIIIEMTNRLLALRNRDNASSNMEEQANDNHSDDSEELDIANDMYNSPLEKMDEILMLEAILQKLDSSNNDLFRALLGALSPHG